MRHAAVIALFLPVLTGCVVASAEAQDAPRRIGPLVFDLRGSVPGFPDDPSLAESRGLDTRELPGRGFGAEAGLHVYPLRWRSVAIGLGGQATVARARSTDVPAAGLQGVTETFTSLAPHLSINFGSGNGWSYLSVGRGTSTWSIVPNGGAAQPGDSERLRTFNYGGGARWFSKAHLGFTFDVRFYEIAPGSPDGARPGSPRTTLLVMSAGISVK